MLIGSAQVALAQFADSAIITEGFNQLTIVTDDGKVFSGVLLEESGLTLSLGQSSGERVDIPKAAIEERKTVPKSAMPEMAETLTPQQVADLAAFLLSMRTPLAVTSANTTAPSSGPSTATGFSFEEQKDLLRISLSGKPVVNFVFRDEKILRPYFANARLADGREAMKQGARSAITVAKGESLKITFGALIHDHREFDMDAEFAVFDLEKH